MKRHRAAGPIGFGATVLVGDAERGSPRPAPRGVGGEPRTRRRPSRDTRTDRPVDVPSGRPERDPGGRRHIAWSPARLSAAVSAIRSGPGPVACERPFDDEVAFFAAMGDRREVRAGAALVHRGTSAPDVHLVERGAIAVLGDHGGRRPILSFALCRELCYAVPALLHEAPWDAVAVRDATVLTMPADVFAAAVRKQWVARWTTRTMTWLAAVGARVADLDVPDPAAQVAALLLRTRGDVAAEPCRRTIADLLDVDDATIRHVLDQLRSAGAIRLSAGRVSVARPEVLRAAAAGTARS